MELSEVVDNPMMVAAANWIATAPLAAKLDQKLYFDRYWKYNNRYYSH